MQARGRNGKQFNSADGLNRLDLFPFRPVGFASRSVVYIAIWPKCNLRYQSDYVTYISSKYY